MLWSKDSTLQWHRLETQRVDRIFLIRSTSGADHDDRRSNMRNDPRPFNVIDSYHDMPLRKVTGPNQMAVNQISLRHSN
jgi:hypothetical protein